MSARGIGSKTLLDRVRTLLVRLKLARALEVLDELVRRIEGGELSALEMLEQLLDEEQTAREGRRLRSASLTARLTRVKTLDSFDFSFQPSLDRHRILTLAQLGFVERGEVVHLLGPPGTGKSQVSTARRG